MSENKIKALEEKVEKFDSNRGQTNANLEAIRWIRKLVLKLNKQKIFFWQLKQEISKLKDTFKTIDLCLKVDGREIKLNRKILWKFIKYKNEWIKDVFVHDIDKYVLTKAQKWHLVAQHIHNKELLEKLDGEKDGIVRKPMGGNKLEVHPADSKPSEPCKHQWDKIEPIECIICGNKRYKKEPTIDGKGGDAKKISADAASAVEKKEAICEKSIDGKHQFQGRHGLYYCRFCDKKWSRQPKEPTEGWNVIIVKRRCPHKYPEMHDSKWYNMCELTRKSCKIENCPKKYLEDEP